ncbi:plasmid mobilization relaxosome protein MobC [Acinetobacter sp. B5B]|uniref:plasmid mobilization relaxosome protein MobC n=1 Tax=Acinetobacter baretiae TaxID=2605383 RepID=UPI0018C2142C|nr:plasmid mobilization relaxosome protein MobC [Acinetobacter baretiae]MBF7683691.1 plasmid mobilization relaxosome protein MobC [Acinetobacter baretiae]
MLGVPPLRPGKAKAGAKMKNEIATQKQQDQKQKQVRNIIKKYRFNQFELEQIDVILKMRNQSLTDFLRKAIQSEIQRSSFYVPTLKELKNNFVLKPKHIKKTEIEIVKRYQNIDPKLLLELSRIGNNINQVARALNIIKKDSATKLVMYDFAQCQIILKNFQSDFQSLLPRLPKIQRSEKAIEKRKAQLEKKGLEL